MTLPQNQNPYFDDFDPKKNFYQVLFKPGVSVQVRELNQLQSILQDQINKFGDNIFKSGTIVSGCHISHHSTLPYVKIKDQETDGGSVTVSDYNNKYIKNATNLTAVIVQTAPGFELKAPDLNTLYVKYINSGDTGEEAAFSANQTLTIYDPKSPLTNVKVLNDSSGFSNTDTVLVLSAIAIQNSTGGKSFSNNFFVGDYISNGLGANVQITAINTANSDSLILNFKPKTADLISGNVALWTLSTDNTIVDANTGETATITALIGQDALIAINTDYIGAIASLQIVSPGSGYDYAPTIAIKSATANSSQLSSANIIAQAYITQVTVANTLTSPIGTGYGMTVGEGVIYQKGYFQRVDEQFIVVDKYANAPDQISVGFDTSEQIINSNIDSSLLDNALETENETAPGADRLKLTPSLVVLGKKAAEANTEFLPIVEFAQGAPYSQNIQTQYNILEQEMAKRTYEESGNFVLDRFNLTTSSPTAFANEANVFTLTVDPGLAYINGYRVATQANYSLDVPKAKTTASANAASISMNYGNYVRVTKMGGSFDINSAKQVGLYDTAGGFNGRSAITAPGNRIGYARVRSIVLENAQTSTYRIYLFDIKMNAGANFKNVRALYTDSNVASIADIVLESGNCALYDNNLSSLIFPTGVKAVQSVNALSYIYKITDTTRTANTLGIITKTLTGNNVFPYTGTLSTAQELDIIVTPLANLVASANLSGTFSTTSGSPTVTGSGTSFTGLYVGDYVKVANATANAFGRIVSIANDTSLTVDANLASSISGNGALYFPQNAPISLAPGSRTANVSADGSLLTINLGTNLAGAANVSLTYNVKATNVAPASKTVNRSVFIRVNVANNSAGVNGPWCLGLSDVFRLRNVYKGANTTFGPGDTGVTDVTKNFYVDHNQTADYYNSAYLFKNPKASYTVGGSDVFLIKVDCYTETEGVFNIGSYAINDTVPFANAGTTINTLEIPEVFSNKDEYYDLRDCIDIRPVTVNTANVTNVYSSATLNPVEPSGNTRFATSSKLFPAPDTSMVFDVNYYLPRVDSVAITEKGDFRIVSDSSVKFSDAITISTMNVPPYPTLPTNLSIDEARYLFTGISNGKYTTRRAADYTISYKFANNDLVQPKGYTMKEIGGLERRISDLEYYVSFNLAETDAKNRVIPSASNTAIDRFKFGFFVDSFGDATYLDTSNPEFNCRIANGRLLPAANTVRVHYTPRDASIQTGTAISSPYVEYPLISQMQATTKIESSQSNTVTEETTIVCSQQMNIVQVDNQNFLQNKNGFIYEISEFYMSGDAGPVSLYINSHDNMIGVDVFQGTMSGFEIFGTTPKFDAFDVVSINQSEFNQYLAGTGPYEPLSGVGYNAGQPSMEDTGKITWTHDPSQGRYYRIRITKYRTSGNARSGEFHYRLHYPVDVCNEVTTANGVTQPSTYNYIGTVVYVDPPSFNAVYSYGQMFNIKVTGLKPSTKHNYIFDGLDYTSACEQAGKTLNDPLVSDASGVLNFSFFYTDMSYGAWGDLFARPMSFNVTSLDGTSTAIGTIEVKSYF